VKVYFENFAFFFLLAKVSSAKVNWFI